MYSFYSKGKYLLDSYTTTSVTLKHQVNDNKMISRVVIFEDNLFDLIQHSFFFSKIKYILWLDKYINETSMYFQRSINFKYIHAQIERMKCIYLFRFSKAFKCRVCWVGDACLLVRSGTRKIFQTTETFC